MPKEMFEIRTSLPPIINLSLLDGFETASVQTVPFLTRDKSIIQYVKGATYWIVR